MLVTADHGNCEMMIDPQTGEPHTAHTLNPVPFILADPDFKGAKLRSKGVLADVAPTALQVMGLAAAEGDEGPRARDAVMVPAPARSRPRRARRAARARLPAALRRVRGGRWTRSRSAPSAPDAVDPVPPGCARCGHPGPDPLCGACLASPPAFDAVRAGGLFGGPLADAVHAFKYGGRPALARPLGAWLAARAPLPGGALVVVGSARARAAHRARLRPGGAARRRARPRRGRPGPPRRGRAPARRARRRPRSGRRARSGRATSRARSRRPPRSPGATSSSSTTSSRPARPPTRPPRAARGRAPGRSSSSRSPARSRLPRSCPRSLPSPPRSPSPPTPAAEARRRDRLARLEAELARDRRDARGARAARRRSPSSPGRRPTSPASPRSSPAWPTTGPPHPEVRALARFRLAELERARGNLQRSAAHLRRLGFVGAWTVVGPFDDEGKRGFDAVLPPEPAIDLAAPMPGKVREVSWRPLPRGGGLAGLRPPRRGGEPVDARWWPTRSRSWRRRATSGCSSGSARAAPPRSS